MGMSDSTSQKEALKPQSQMWPLFYKEYLEVGNKESPVAVCTMWGLKEFVIRKLDKESYSVIANLYTSDGINYIIKNVLANPHIKHIILFGADMMKTGEALVGLVRDGVDAQNKIKNTNAFVDEVIAANNLELFRNNVKIHDLRGTNDINILTELVKKLNSEDNRIPFAEPQYITEEGKKVEGLDTVDVGYIVKGNTISQVWLKVIDAVMKFGEEKQTSFGNRQKEILNMQAVILGDEEKMPEWIPADVVKKYIEDFFAKKVPDNVKYTYINRLSVSKTKTHGDVDQIAAAIEELKKEPFTRRAVAVTWDIDEDFKSKDAPCLVTIVWNYKNGKLHQTVEFRSHDLFRAWAPNAYALRELQKIVSVGTGMAMGSLTIISNSAHIYNDCWVAADKTIEKYHRHKSVIIENDPRGYFLVTTDPKSKEIVVQHARNLDGKKSKYVFRGINPEVILKQIANKGLTDNIYHNMYLGKEVERAKAAIDSGEQYVQDAA